MSEGPPVGAILSDLAMPLIAILILFLIMGLLPINDQPLISGSRLVAIVWIMALLSVVAMLLVSVWPHHFKAEGEPPTSPWLIPVVLVECVALTAGSVLAAIWAFSGPNLEPWVAFCGAAAVLLEFARRLLR